MFHGTHFSDEVNKLSPNSVPVNSSTLIPFSLAISKPIFINKVEFKSYGKVLQILAGREESIQRKPRKDIGKVLCVQTRIY